jgi:L-alanine-DL-glutamate epimerase-like enolase superfamily enzyme
MPLSLTVRTVELPLRHAWTLSRGTSTAKRNVLVELHDGERVGRGEAAPNVRYGESAETVTDALEKLVPVLDGDPRHFRVLSEHIEWMAARLGPLVDWLDLDGNLLVSADPFRGLP